MANEEMIELILYEWIPSEYSDVKKIVLISIKLD